MTRCRGSSACPAHPAPLTPERFWAACLTPGSPSTSSFRARPGSPCWTRPACRFRDSHWAADLATWLGSRRGRRGPRLLAGRLTSPRARRRGPTGRAAWSSFRHRPRPWPASRSGCPRTCCNGPPTSRSRRRRPLVVVPRETPYTRATLQHLLELHDAGAVVLPASPGFYSAPRIGRPARRLRRGQGARRAGRAARLDHPLDRRARAAPADRAVPYPDGMPLTELRKAELAEKVAAGERLDYAGRRRSLRRRRPGLARAVSRTASGPRRTPTSPTSTSTGT